MLALKFFSFFVLFSGINFVDCIRTSRRFFDSSRIPCESPENFPNGYSIVGRHNSVSQHYCDRGFKLIGDKRTPCYRGKWKGDRPVCAKMGCTVPLEKPDNGRILSNNPFQIEIHCSERYVVAGNRIAYCNGTNWDRELGYCRMHLGLNHECDFETVDICGWVFDESDAFKWKRAMALNVFTSFHTGPQHDHTTMKESGGHYMLMESFGVTTTPALLTSPIYARDLSLKTACCFQFYYFMYGAGVGNLNVYVKPVSKMLNYIMANKQSYLKFSKSGEQNTNWNEAHFNIQEMEDDFQIVFVADGAKSHLSDIAIDDVKIMTGLDCKSLDNRDDEPDDSAEFEPTTTEEALYDTSSCVSRCNQESNAGIMRNFSRILGLCSCHDTCEADDDCCPDYVAVCLNGPDDDLTTNIISTTTTTTMTPTSTLKSTVTAPNKTTTAFTTTKTTRLPTTARSTQNTTTTTTIKTTTPTTSTSTTLTTKPTTRVTTTATTTTTTTTTPTIPKTTRTTTTRKPTFPTTITSTTTTTTATTKRVIPTTTSTTERTMPTTQRTTPKRTTITTSTIKTTSATKRSTISNTTSTAATTTPYNTHPIFVRTTVQPIDHKVTITDQMDLQRKEKTQLQKNVTKQTWDLKPKSESNPRSALALLFIFGLLVTVIIASAIYRKQGTLKRILFGKILQNKNQNDDNGTEDCNSIIANFQQEDASVSSNTNMAASASATGNRLKLTLSSLRKGKTEKRNSSGEEYLYNDNENDEIPLI